MNKTKTKYCVMEEKSDKLPNLIFVLEDTNNDTNDDTQIVRLQEMYNQNYQSLKKKMLIYLYIWIMLISCLAGITLLMVENDKKYGAFILAFGISLCLATSFFK